MRCHKVDYEILGGDMQVVEVELDPGETVIAEAGAMNWMDDGITFEARMGDGSKQSGGIFDKLLDVGKRALTGESIYLQSLPFSRLADRIIQHAPSSGGKEKGEGSVLGGLGGIIDGD